MTARKAEEVEVKVPFLSKEKRTQIVFILVFAFVFFVVGALASDSIVSAMPNRQEIPTETLEGIFLDVNGDGLVDFIVYADVIMNDGDSNLAVGQ